MSSTVPTPAASAGAGKRAASSVPVGGSLDEVLRRQLPVLRGKYATGLGGRVARRPCRSQRTRRPVPARARPCDPPSERCRPSVAPFPQAMPLLSRRARWYDRARPLAHECLPLTPADGTRTRSLARRSVRWRPASATKTSRTRSGFSPPLPRTCAHATGQGVQLSPAPRALVRHASGTHPT